jgi:preprotein translocase subunit SecG
MLHSILMVIQIISATCIVALVLVQRGKGADAGAGFGSGASGTVFGARGATTALSRATAILAAVFMLTSLTLAYMVTRGVGTTESVLDRLAGQGTTQAPASAPAAAPAVPAAPAAPAAQQLPEAPAPSAPPTTAPVAPAPK